MDFLKDLISVVLILFAVIDILGSIPVLVDIKQKTGRIYSEKATLAAGLIMLAFLLFGEGLLNLIGIDLASFATAGSIVIFLVGLEMIMGQTILKPTLDPTAASIVPIAFPLIAGAGTLTTILSLKTQYSFQIIIVGILVNLVIVFAVLKFVPRLERTLGTAGIDILRRIFGIILIAISVKIFKTYWLM